MDSENKNNYSITAKYNNFGDSLEEILKTYLQNLTKISPKDWNLIENGVKYK